MPEFTDITIPTLFSLLFAAPIPTLVIFMKIFATCNIQGVRFAKSE